ncbi:UBX domain-containing 2 [Schistosoma japonicum]|uniref:UBX domain-containing 2 n=1 Tax=Schistosoma japonicum TaxID=6182 RepID=A0A4Z2D865_SCHJA|nr:UBX domain-containing 2 [Schistosoma japonicum]
MLSEQIGCTSSYSFSESPSKDPHVYLRFPRYRWHLDYQSPLKKRKTASQKLWCTLQNGLKAFGIPPDLVPVVTRRAYSIAGLSIPSSLANYLDILNPRVSVSHPTGNNCANNNSTASSGTNNRLQLSGFIGTNSSTAHSNSFQRKTFSNNHSDYSRDTLVNSVFHEDDEHDYTLSDRSQDSVSFVNGRLGGVSALNATAGGDDGKQSFDGILTVTKRTNNNQKTISDDASLLDRKDLQDDSQDVQYRNNGRHHHMNLSKSDYSSNKTYDLDNVSEDGDDQNGDYDGEDDDGEIGDDIDDVDDDEDDVNDAVWFTGKRRATGGSGNLSNNSLADGGGNSDATIDGSGRRGKTRSSMYSLKVTKYNS